MALADVFDDLDAWLADDSDGESTDGESTVVVQDRDHANRLVRQIERIRREAVVVVETAQAEIDRVVEFRDGRLEILAGEELRVLARLESYHRMEHSQDAGLLTLHLPNGDTLLRAQEPEWDFGEDFVEWAIEHLPGAVNVPTEPPPPTPDRLAAKRLLTQERTDEKGKVVAVEYGVTPSGERPPGVTVEVRDRKFSVGKVTPRPKEFEKVIKRLTDADEAGVTL